MGYSLTIILFTLIFSLLRVPFKGEFSLQSCFSGQIFTYLLSRNQFLSLISKETASLKQWDGYFTQREIAAVELTHWCYIIGSHHRGSFFCLVRTSWMIHVRLSHLGTIAHWQNWGIYSMGPFHPPTPTKASCPVTEGPWFLPRISAQEFATASPEFCRIWKAERKCQNNQLMFFSVMHCDEESFRKVWARHDIILLHI